MEESRWNYERMCASSGGPLAYVEVIIRKKKKVAEEKITKRNIGFISLLLIYYMDMYMDYDFWEDFKRWLVDRYDGKMRR